MILDTSAILAILLSEPEAAEFAAAIQADPKRLLSAISYVEAAIVLEARKGSQATHDLDFLIHRAAIDVIPFDLAQAERARRAWIQFGKGRHPAALNMGDCCVYALSAVTSEPVLFKGSDFAHTDARRVPQA
ncbi:MAG: type II toxin-antitoxin system VapC family toxin [Planctomycetes bacterium]|nr:type II toxin-antitoxin system VapC family toxin [Planctomycetota bacterium]